MSNAAAWRQHALAAALFLVGALWALRVVLPAPASTFPIPATLPPKWRGIVQADQKLSATNITWNARRWFTEPWRMYEPGQCYPARHAAALGPHQLGEGLIGVLPYVITRDPVVTYNVVAVAVLWLPALTMYALVYGLTGSGAGAFIAGLLFALHPSRIGDVIHPDVLGNEWAPLTLLFTYRLFGAGRWRDGAGLLISLVLQVLGSVYQLLGFVVIGGTCGLFLLAAARARLASVLPKLIVAAAGTAVAAWLVLTPYVHMRDTWQVVSGRETLLFTLHDFALGGQAYPGSLLVLLAVLGVLHRWRGPCQRYAHDPRVALLVASALTVWASVWSVPLWPLGVTVPSLFALARNVLPGLDAIRAGAVIGFGVVLTGAVLAGYGVAALTARRSFAARAVITALLAVATVFEIFVDRVAVLSFGRSAAMQAYAVRPPDVLVDLYRTAARGAVLDVPYDFRIGSFVRMADGAFLSAFHLHPVAACYNSFQLPLHKDIAALAKRLGSDQRAADALSALGIDTVVSDDLRRGRGLGTIGAIDGRPAGLALLGRAAAHSAFRVESNAAVTTRIDVLEPAAPTAEAEAASPPEAPVTLTFRNGSASTFRHPDPIEPTRLRLHWRAAGTLVREDDVRILLPVALAGGDELARTVTVPVPSPGDFEVTLTLPDAPEHVLARASIRVTAPAPGSAAPPPAH